MTSESSREIDGTAIGRSSPNRVLEPGEYARFSQIHFTDCLSRLHHVHDRVSRSKGKGDLVATV